MRSLLCAAVLVLIGGVLAGPVCSGSPEADPAARKVNPDRLMGMKAALADLETGRLKIKSPALPVPAWNDSYLELLEKECGVEWVTVNDSVGHAAIELRGYNDVMILEIEHRFGKGILDKLQKKAEESFRQSLDAK
jgi:hypothetical protein